MLWDSKSFGPRHQAWLLGTSLIAIGCVILYGYAAAGQPRWPGGASKIGLAFGVIAGLIFLFEFLLWPRKTSFFRTARWLGKTQTWMHAHLWLGLLTLPLVVMHSGFAVGGTFTLVFLILYGAVMTSGILGLVLQNFLPRILLDLVPHETVASQLEVVAKQLAIDADRILSVYVEGAQATTSLSGAAAAVKEEHQVGAQRRVGTVLPVQLHPEQSLTKPLPSPEIIRAVREVIEPYLLTGRDSRALLGTKRQNAQYFGELRRVAPPDLRDAVAVLAELCERRRQLAVQERIHSWLHGWMLVHLPLSAALMVLLIGHIFLALYYN